MQFSSFIKSTLSEAVGVARANFGKVQSSIKQGDNNQVLTQTDLEIGRLIVDSITSAFPSHSIIDEEAGVIEKMSHYTWVVDPIDGTSNFAAGLPTYGIMIGLLEGGVPIAGGIALPYFNDIYWAEKGMGAYRNDAKMYVSKEKNLSNVLVAYGIDGYPSSPEITKKECVVLSDIIVKIRNLRTSNSCFDAAMVARGNYGAWLNQTQKIWDHVAEHILIEEAGGLYTDFYGRKIDYSNPTKRVGEQFSVCAASPTLHAELQKIITYAITN